MHEHLGACERRNERGNIPVPMLEFPWVQMFLIWCTGPMFSYPLYDFKDLYSRLLEIHELSTFLSFHFLSLLFNMLDKKGGGKYYPNLY